MKLLLNNKEIAHFLLSLEDHTDSCRSIEHYDYELGVTVSWVLYLKAKEKFRIEKFRDKIKEKLHKAIAKDMQKYMNKVRACLEERRKSHYELVHQNIEYFINKLGEDNILDLYKKSKKENFVKSLGLKLDDNAELIRRHRFTDYTQDCLIRNTVGNEKLLIQKIDNNYPFWFIDSGYTNFLEVNKAWHRVVRNHLHSNKTIDAPVDRLGNFKKFPQEWRTSGEKILIIEPGPFAAGIFHVDLKTWKYDVEKELRQYTDRPIEFREKANRKIRTNLYKTLCDEDYYCVININSNAATEAIWAGIPVITLDKHITNSVSSNKLSDIGNLYRPNLASWLCTLSYSQFTYDELIDGTALKIIKKYHV